MPTEPGPNFDDEDILLTNSRSSASYREIQAQILDRQRRRQGVEMEPRMFSAPAIQIQGVGVTGSDGYIPLQGLQDITRPEIPQENVAPQNFQAPQDDEHYIRLSNAMVRIEEEFRRTSHFEEGVGRREAEYRNMLRTQKLQNMKPEEYVFSEIPRLISHVPSNMLRQIADARICNNLHFVGRSHHYLCSKCGLDTPSEYAYFCNGSVWCAEHVPNLEMCAMCYELKTECKLIDNYFANEVYACNDCLSYLRQGAIECRRCSRRLPKDSDEWIGTDHCAGCIDEDNEDDVWREFSYKMKWVGKDKGAIVKSTRIFSCEVEALTDEASGAERLAATMPDECGLSSDGSIERDSGRYDQQGIEVQTPKLAGKKGEDCVRRTISALRTVEATVNKSCGLHIHLDAKGILLPRRKEYPAALLQLWKTHLIFEDMLLSFLPFERRSNDYCRLMAGSFKITEVDMCDSLFDVEKLWYKMTRQRDIQAQKRHHYHSSRYFGINLHSLLAHGHLEIRYHSGTTNGRKILEWANLHCLIMDACAAKKMSPSFFREVQATTNLRQKTDLLFEKIGMSESSRQYFYSRQKKFADKTNDESKII